MKSGGRGGGTKTQSDKSIFFCPFLAERVDMAAIILSRVNREQINSAEGNLIELPFLPEKKEWLSEFVVEMLMLDG